MGWIYVDGAISYFRFLCKDMQNLFAISPTDQQCVGVFTIFIIYAFCRPVEYIIPVHYSIAFRVVDPLARFATRSLHLLHTYNAVN